MSLKSITDRETRVYIELVRSLNHDDTTVAEIEEAIEKRRKIISVTPNRLSVVQRLYLLAEVIQSELFVGSDAQIKRRMSGELNGILYALKSEVRDDQ